MGFLFSEETASIREFLQFKRASALSQHTVVTYEFHLKQFWQWLQRNRIEKVTERDMADYFVYLRSLNYAPSTLRDKWVALHAYFRFCNREQLLQRIKKPAPSPRARAFTDSELEDIMQAIANPDSFTAIRDYTVICVLLGTGIRKAELLSLSCRDISNDFLTVTGKGNKRRNVPVSPQLEKALYRYEKARTALFPTTDKVFITRDGKPLTAGGLRAIFTRLQKRTGISGKRFSPHTFRHTFATNWIRNGGSLPSLQRVLGHTDVSTTGIYLSWSDNAVLQENNICCPLDKILL